MCRAENPSDFHHHDNAIQSLIEWECTKCTFINKGDNWECIICGSLRSWDRTFEEDTLTKGSSSSKSFQETHLGGANALADGEVGGETVYSAACGGEEVRMVLLGWTGAGKSSSGNTILGNNVFPSSLSPTAVTKECRRGTSIRFERRLQVIDTPGMYDTEMPIADIAREVVKCVGMTAPGPHAFILPVRVDRFTEEEQNTIEHFLNIFGRGMLDFLIILFTKKDDLINDNQTIEEFLGRESNKLKSILDDCNGRYITFNNRGSPSEKDQDVQTLLEVIDKMVHDNGGKVFTNEMFQEAEKVMQEKEDQLKREYEETMQSQLDGVTHLDIHNICRRICSHVPLLIPVWTCPTCSFINEVEETRCEICRAENPSDLHHHDNAIQSLIEWECTKCTFINKGDNWECIICGSLRSWDRTFEEDTLTKGSSSSKSFQETHLGGANALADGEVGGVTVYSAACGGEEVRMVLLGRTGAGKSSSGNTILGNNVFPSSLSPTSVTKECKRGTSIRFERRLQVIDTPGMYDTEMPIADIAREVVKCVGMTAPGPHAFILPVRVDRFTEEEQNTIEHFLNIFGRGMLDYLIILFTKKDDLIYNNQTIEEFLGKKSNKLKSILDDCNGRYITFNNRGSPSEKDQDVKTLLEVIDKMVHDNGGKVYTNEIYQEAEKVMQEKEDQLKREYEETMQSQLDEVRRQTKLQVKQLEQDHEEVIKQFSTRLEQLDAECESQSSTSDCENIRRQLQELKLQHKNEIQAIRDLEAKKVQVDFREQARCETEKGGSFLRTKCYLHLSF